MFHVKHSDDNALLSADQVSAALRKAEISTSEAEIKALTRHGNAVLQANKTINLTAVTEPESFSRLHIVDALLPLGMLDASPGLTLDMGTGAGYPGIPWAIFGVEMVLCEATKKKAALLAEWVKDLPVGPDVVSLRAEEYAISRPGAFDTVVARAVSALPSLLELASPLLREGGRLLAMKGAPTADEIAWADRAAGLVGMERSHLLEYALPGGGERRTLCVYEKAGTAVVALPRRPGMAQRQPLGG
jgi:16S rRNA (guanine527-N7)-methyltransferase